MVTIGDLVAIAYGGCVDLIARITDGRQHQLHCQITHGQGVGLELGRIVTVTPDQLLLKVHPQPACGNDGGQW
jgi:hypothetical protein